MCDMPYCYPVAVLAWYPSVDGPRGCARCADPATLATELAAGCSAHLCCRAALCPCCSVEEERGDRAAAVIHADRVRGPSRRSFAPSPLPGCRTAVCGAVSVAGMPSSCAPAPMQTARHPGAEHHRRDDAFVRAGTVCADWAHGACDSRGERPPALQPPVPPGATRSAPRELSWDGCYTV